MSNKNISVFIDDLVRRQSARARDIASISALSLFADLSEKNLQMLLSNSHIVEMEAGQVITEQGDDPAFLYYIMAGNVKTLRYSPEGKEATIRMLGAGETFMEDVVFTGGASPIHAVAVNNSQMLIIPAQMVRRQALSDPQFSLNLLKIISRHYRNAVQQIDCIVTKNPVERLGYYFLKLHLEQGSDSMEISLPFQKSTIANHLGITPETFSRALAQIKKMGIDVDQEKLTLRDVYALCHFCDHDMGHDCPHYNTPECSLCPNEKGKSCH